MDLSSEFTMTMRVFSPARPSEVPSGMPDILRGELKERSWVEPNNLSSIYINQLIGWTALQIFTYIESFCLCKIICWKHIAPLSDKKKLAFNLTETVRGLFQVYDSKDGNCERSKKDNYNKSIRDVGIKLQTRIWL